MNLLEIADKYNGMEYRETPRIELPGGVVVAMPQSDNLIEWLGAISDESGHGPIGIFNGDFVRNECCEGENCPNFKTPDYDYVVECEFEPEDAAWKVKVNTECAYFDIMEDGEIYGVGIVFSLIKSMDDDS